MNAPRLAVVLLALSLASCVSFEDRAGVPIHRRQLSEIVPGKSTRQHVLNSLGPPTGMFSTNLLSALTRFGSAVGAPRSTARIDDDVFTYQEIHITARAFFFPVLFAWGAADITSRTAIVFFDENGLVSYVGFREDRS